MNAKARVCADCEIGAENRHETPNGGELDRRGFLRAAGAGAALATFGALPKIVVAADAPDKPTPENLVKSLYDALGDNQRKEVCFAWDHVTKDEGLLRTRVSNNWQITQHDVIGDFYNKEQKEIIRAIFEGIYNPDWIKRIDQQLSDDAGGYGMGQGIAIFGKPGDDKFEFVMTGRHMTIRCDGNSTEHMAFGGPIFYGHAARGFDEDAGHEGNVFWHQALAANKVFGMLDGKQRKAALLPSLPSENAVSFQGAKGEFPGVPLAELSSDQTAEVQRVLTLLLEPYRKADQEEVARCLQAQGGLEKCSLAFYKDEDIGDDGVWDCWRLEGPAFVWYFRGSPHVHVWVNISDDPSVATNA